jgi:flavin prenyltransferase
MSDATRRLIVGISGASGTAYGMAALSMLRDLGIETHLVVTQSAKVAMAHEVPMKLREIEALASVVHRVEHIGASIASGSFRTMGMLVAPCSIRSLSEIAYGTTSNLLTRAADVVLKERRRLVLMVRETPLHLGHLRAMTLATEAGAIVMPPVPALYALPGSIDEMVRYTVGRSLDLFGLDCGTIRRWREGDAPARADDRPASPVGPSEDIGSAAWRFALDFYGRDGVSAACLSLQEELGVDVPLMLTALFADIRLGLQISESAVASLDRHAAAWQGEVVAGLRRANHGLKSQAGSMAPDSERGPLRDRVKALELETEKVEIRELARHLQTLPKGGRLGIAMVLRTVAHHFARASGRTADTPAISQALAALAVEAERFIETLQTDQESENA